MSPVLHSPHEASIIKALQYQGNRNDCAPFTIATIISAFTGLEIDGAVLATQMNKPVWRGIFPVIRRIPNWATLPWGMVDVLQNYGLAARWGFRYTTDYLRMSVQKGNLPIPIIGSWRPLWGHVMTLIAWDENGHWGFANTQMNEKNIDWKPEEYFNKHWKTFSRLCVEGILAE